MNLFSARLEFMRKEIYLLVQQGILYTLGLGLNLAQDHPLWGRVSRRRKYGTYLTHIH